MELEIISSIVDSLETWKDPSKIGEEVRSMKDAIRQKSENDIDPVMEGLYQMIDLFEDDYQLGKAIRQIYIPLKVIVNDKGYPTGNNEA